MIISTVFNYYNTIKYLKPRQISSQFLFRVFNKPLKINYTHKVELRQLPDIDNFVPRWTGGKFDCKLKIFEFLGQQQSYYMDINWNENKYGGLWLDNLHYFRYLEECSSDDIVVIYNIILNWKENSRKVPKAFFPPYNASERAFCIGRWLILNQKYLSTEQRTNILTILAADIDFISDNLEWHLDGNHLLKNLSALWWGTKVLTSDLHAKWERILKKHLYKTIEEQILHDGLHYEKSPKYHQIALIDFMDILTVIDKNDQEHEYLRNLTKKMASALSMLTHPDGNTCLFNDAPSNLTSSTNEVLRYCEKCLGSLSSVNCLDHAGYYQFKNDDLYVVADFGDLGPDEQMGHAHSDMFHFELSYKNTRVLVEGGTSSYYSPVRRKYERSTLAHNTVTVNNCSQSTNWHNFRVAQRGHCSLISASNDVNELDLVAEHDGYKNSFNLLHKRHLVCNSNGLVITDTIKVKDALSRQLSSNLHFSENCIVEITSDSSATINLKDGQQLYFTVINALYTLERMEYSQNYNELKKGTRLSMSPISENAAIIYTITIQV